ncbi:hypothetical protein KP509_03G078100 [Ceratopteris richardii]|uniref:J domain-containing protein n=1 Tax=Ceratopteris richardii TaxID=49495 RepID=A0A8T2VCT5_CERRI|nr:hypothetical protein KP509_03G078100 [Ceratopteris richardii]
MSYRVDRSPKISSKVSPMHSPRISASGVFGSRTIPPSPLRKGLEGPPSVSILPAVDYDDVFGGPPRFAPSLFAAQTPQTPSTVLDRSCPRTPSFRSSSFPVFELPVFGDDVFGSSSAVDQRNSSLPHEAISKEEVHAPNVIPEAIPASLLQSKPGSRSSSRCMSPAHSVVTSPGHHGQGEMHKSSDTFVGRSSTGNALSRNLSSSSSFDETRSNTCDSSAILSRTDMVGSSLLSSPPHASVWGHLNRVHGVSNTKQKGVNTLDDVDDVFGGLPRTYSLALSAAYQRTSSPPRTKSASSKGITHHMAQKNTFTSQMFEPSGTLDPTFQKSLSNGRQASQDNFVDIRTDRERENSALKKLDGRTGEGLALVNDMKFATQLASKWMPARPPPSPAPSTPSTPLRHKSWKDWASEASSNQTVSHDCSSKVGEMAAVNGIAPTLKKGPNKSTTISHIQKGSAETVYKKQLENSQESQKLQGKYTLSSSNINVLKVKPLKQTMDLEDRELQAILTNAWKLNEKWEKKKSAAARTRQESTRVLETRLQEPHIKEGKRQSKKLSKPVPQVSHTKEDRGENMQRKSWRNYSEQKSESPGEPAKAGCSAEDCMTNSCQPSTQDIVKEKTENPVMQNGIFEAEDNFDPEEIVSEVTEEMPVSDTSNEVPAKWAGVDPKRDSGKSAKEDMEVCVAEKPLAASTNGEGPTLTALNTDFGQGDLQEFLMSEGLENTGPLTVINASLEGFQEIEGETLERRKARWARHQQAKERAVNAKAIEEMQRRDAEVQRQQEEKQQLAGIADHQIKRWASGKEANIRALLSNLQHVLWENSGWQPVSLRDLIEGSDVKKAYRKATLFVHPDKVQQKGATLHQKYVAERVFDILQEAWKTFNLQELF